MFLRVLICRRLAREETERMRGEEAAASDQEAGVPRGAAGRWRPLFNVTRAALDRKFPPFETI